MKLLIVLMTCAVLFEPAQAAPSLVEEGRSVYNYRCYFCHGYSGDGQTLAATYLNPKPSNFKVATPERLSPAAVQKVLEEGRAGTAMKSFSNILSEHEMLAVATFVVDEFVNRKADNTRYHTAENGWPNHERYSAAFPFAKGEIALSRPWESLNELESAGKRLYLSSCVSCHDRGTPTHDEIAWDARPLSFPRNNFSLADPRPIDAMTSASPYALHDIAPKVSGLSERERAGEHLFQVNCAFCHGADGSGQNWIGQFMEPHPRNLRNPEFMKSATRATLTNAIREGLPNTSMPAWKSVLSDQEIQSILDYIDRAFHPLADSTSPNLGE